MHGKLHVWHLLFDIFKTLCHIKQNKTNKFSMMSSMCLSTLTDQGQWPIRVCVQGCCLTGAQEPEAPVIYPRATKISTGEKKKFPAQSALWNDNRKRLIVDHRRKKKFPPIKGKHTPLCLEIRFSDFCCRAVEVSRHGVKLI